MYPFKDRLGPVLAQYALADILPDRGARLALSALRAHSQLLGRRDVVHVLWAPTRPLEALRVPPVQEARLD